MEVDQPGRNRQPAGIYNHSSRLFSTVAHRPDDAAVDLYICLAGRSTASVVDKSSPDEKVDHSSPTALRIRSSIDKGMKP